MKKVIALLLASLMTFSMAASAESGEAAEDSAGGDTLVAMTERDVDSYDPFTCAQYDTITLNQVFDTLFMWDEDGNVVGRLAESWVEEDDGVTVTVNLHQGVKFHDGTDVDADAIVWNYEQLMDGPWGTALPAYLTDISKVDDYTITITKLTPASTALDILCYFMRIVSPTSYEADPEGFAMNPVGSGPYIWESKDATSGVITMAANEDYFLGAPAIKTLELVPPMDSSTALVALENGELNWAPEMTNSDIVLAESIDNVIGMSSSGWSTLTMMLVGEPMSSDQNLRNAIAYAINRENAAIFNNENEYVAAEDLFSTDIMGDLTGETSPAYYDPDLAEEYLAESDYDGEVIMINTLDVYADVATSIQNDLSAVGINSQINEVDRATWNEMMNNGTLQISTIDFGGVYNGPTEMMSYYVSDGYYGALGIFGTSDEFDEAYQIACETSDPEELDEALINAIQAMSDLNNFVSLYEMMFNSACTANLQGVHPVWGATLAPYFYQCTFE